MQVDGITGSGVYNTSATKRTYQSGASFNDALTAAQSKSDDSTKTQTQTKTKAASSTSSDNAVQDFEDYMKETPAQRMFDGWLGEHHISKAQYAAMSPEEKAKIQAEFQEYLKKKMEGKLGVTGVTGGTTATAT